MIHHAHQVIFESDAIIWKMVIEPTLPALIVETRDETAQQATFIALDLQKHSTLWNDLTFEDGWWMSLADAGDGMAYFVPLSDEPFSKKTGLAAVDVKQKTIVWYNESVQFGQIIRQGVMAYQWEGEERKMMMLDAKNGKNMTTNMQVNPHQNLHIPSRYTEEMPYFQIVSHFLQKKIGTSPVKAADYWETDHAIIIAFYTAENSLLKNYLAIFDRQNGNLLHDECLGECPNGIGSEAFFLYHQLLFYITDKRKLSSIALG
jgi:Domain of unknown function (DUF4905)